jgi:hypothetical protein
MTWLPRSENPATLTSVRVAGLSPPDEADEKHRQLLPGLEVGKDKGAQWGTDEIMHPRATIGYDAEVLPDATATLHEARYQS